MLMRIWSRTLSMIGCRCLILLRRISRGRRLRCKHHRDRSRSWIRLLHLSLLHLGLLHRMAHYRHMVRSQHEIGLDFECTTPWIWSV